MTNRVTFLGALALAIGCSVAGYQYAAALYGEDIAALREDYASRSQALEEKYREKERVQHQSLVEAWEERDKALANVERLSDDVDWVRKQAADARSRLSASYSKGARSWFEEVSNYLSALR